MARLLFTLALFLPAAAAFAQTGKITGTVTDVATGEVLPGVNVSIAPTTYGAVTNADGYYVILNVRPGTYDVRATFVGFTPIVQENVHVNIDLTSNVDFALQEEIVGLEEIVVQAGRPLVQPDVSASVANIASKDIENLPLADIRDVIGLQAGFESGLVVRGEGADQVRVLVDGMAFTDARHNAPLTDVSYTAVDWVQVQTGGFNAEYGNVRSGLINVVTRDPPRSRYTADAVVRYTPAFQKHFPGTDPFGNEVALPSSPGSFYVFPFLDTTPRPGCPNGVAIDGSDCLPAHLQRQFSPFEGWVAHAGNYSERQLMEAFRWLTRKDLRIDRPDYELDATIGGPVPGISRQLGDLRFLASYRGKSHQYIAPQQRSSEDLTMLQGKLAADLGRGMRLQLNGMWSEKKGLNASPSGGPAMFTANSLALVDHFALWSDWWWNPMDVTRSIVGGQLTHAVSPTTFYEVRLQRNASDYLTVAAEPRPEAADETNLIVACVTPDARTVDAPDHSCSAGHIPLTTAPLGYEPVAEDDGLGVGIVAGGHGGVSRDSSTTVRWLAGFDLTSQINRYVQIKAGLEYIANDYDIKHGSYDPFFVHKVNPKYRWNRYPGQGAVYGQTKLEFQGMVANLGLRADYFHPRGEWYLYEPFDRAFAGRAGVDNLNENLDTEPVEYQLTLSPRVGISFPITEDSKVYFNYGHFRQMPSPSALFEIQTTQIGAVAGIGNPNMPLPKTVAYELGFEQNVADMFLLRLGAFYRDLSRQPRGVLFIGLGDAVRYTRSLPLNYADHRGFEFTLTKSRGDWLRGFVNYTYLVKKFGNFGFGQINENDVEMREYVRTSKDHYQRMPFPEPFARMNFELVTPRDFGPKIAGFGVLGDWRLSLLGEWRSGQKLTWDGGSLTSGIGGNPDLAYNTAWKDFWMFDLRISRNVETSVGRVQLFVDIANVFNIRNMQRFGAFAGARDDMFYMQSLHLSEDVFEGLEEPPYLFVPGDDRPGDYREPGVAFDPIFPVTNVADQMSPVAGALYWEKSTGDYKVFENGSWRPADAERVDRVLDSKAYIDMPNKVFHTFLNPRNVLFGLRLSF